MLDEKERTIITMDVLKRYGEVNDDVENETIKGRIKRIWGGER